MPSSHNVLLERAQKTVVEPVATAVSIRKMTARAGVLRGVAGMGRFAADRDRAVAARLRRGARKRLTSTPICT